MGFGYGVAGAAIGDGAGRGVGVGPRHRRAAPARLASALRSTWGEILDRAAMLHTLAMNRDIMIRNVALIAAFAIFTALGARAGDVTLAANAVLYNMFLIGGYFLDGFATAAETLCGQCVGARDEREFPPRRRA